MSGKIRVFAPGSVGNLGPGFDVVGLAIGGIPAALPHEKFSAAAAPGLA
jgi:homoserine kinase